MLKKSSALILAFIMLLGGPINNGFADQSASVLVNLMLKKGIITPEEAVEVLADLESMEDAQQGTSNSDDDAKLLSKIPQKGIVVGSEQGKYLNIGGRVQADAYFGDKVLRQKNTFDVRRARINISGRIAADVKYKVQIDAAGSSTVLKDGKVTWDKFEPVNLTAGQFHIPFGEEELTSSTKIHTMERSIVTEAIAPSRDRGAMLHGKLLDGFLEYNAGVFNGNGTGKRNDNEKFLYAGRVILTPLKTEINGEKAKLQVGGAIAYSEDDGLDLEDLGFEDFTGDRTLYSLNGKFTWGPLTLRGEYLRADLDYDGMAATATKKADPARSSVGDGWYGILSYFFLPKWEAVFKYEDFNSDDAKDFDAVTLGLNYYFNEWTNKKLYPTRFMINYVHGGYDGSPDGDQVLMRFQVGI